MEPNLNSNVTQRRRSKAKMLVAVGEAQATVSPQPSVPTPDEIRQLAYAKWETAGKPPGLIAYRFYAPLVFANADHFMQRIRGLVAGCPNPVRCVLIDVQAVTEVDVTAAEMLLRLGAELDAQGIHLKFARANRPLREQILRLGLGEHLDESTVFLSVHAAIEAFLREPSGAGPAGIDAVAARQQVR